MKKRVFAILMTFAMVFSMLPATALAVEGEGTTINLSEGSYTIETAGAYAVLAYTGANTLTVKADATITLAGVNITAAADTSAISIESGNVTLVIAADSTMTGGDNGAGIYVAEGASVTIQSENNAKLTAIGNAGTDDDSGAAGIGGTWVNGNSGAITIDGTTVVAEGYGVHGSGIGSGSGKVVGEIKIVNGANVTAYGGYYANGAGTKLQSSYGKSDPEGSAAIGGGGKTASTIANITITDSTVVANGGSKAAGIGANFWCSTGTITISGNSNVTAQGGSSSAGIGTSRAGDSGVSANIIISGGTVTATGGDYGAGIGTGYNADSLGNGAAVSGRPETSITISGGVITATGGEGGAGIGGGYKSDNVDIDITGGSVTAAAGALVSGKTVKNGGSACGIGSGANGSGTFENSPAVEFVEGAIISVTAYEDGKPAIEGVENNTLDGYGVVYNNGVYSLVACHTVTFETNGGSAVAAQEIVSGEKAIKPENPTMAGYTFRGWYSDSGLTTEFSFDTAITTDITVYAKWSKNSSGGGTSAPQQTIPAVDGAVQVSYTTSSGTASLSLPESKINDIIAKSKGDEALIDLSKVSGATAAELPKAALTAFAEAGLGLSIQLPAGNITLNPEAAADIAGQASSSNLKLELKQAASSSLSAVQREAIKSGDMVLDINIYSGAGKITQFDGKLTIEVPYTGPQPVAVWYLNDKGELEKLTAVFANGIVSFELNHLFLYVLGQDTDWVNPFADIQEADWFYKAVEYVYKNGLMMGTGDTAFDPNGTTTRAMIVTILHRLEQTPAPTANNPFGDVADGKWYTNAVVWAAESGLVSGYGNNTFGPEDNITREQMAVILYRYAQLKSYDVSGGADLSKFNDAENISGWALRSLGWANEKGLITGTSDVTLDPQGQATRAQVAAILQRFIENITK